MHSLRHLFANSIGGEVPTAVVQQVMGHKNLTTTERYLSQLGNMGAMKSAFDHVGGEKQ